MLGPAQPQRSHLKGFFGLSLLVHLNLVLLATAYLSLNPDGCAVSDLPLEPFEVALVPSEVEQVAMAEELELRTDETLPEKLKEEEKKEEQKEKDEKGQVVEIAPPREEQRPESSKYLSEYDSKVVKETRGKPMPFKPGALVAAQPLPPQPPQPPQLERKVPQPPAPVEKEQPQQKTLKLTMRTRPEMPESRLPDAESGDEPARTEPVPKNLPRGPIAPEQEAAGPAPRVPREIRLTPQELSRILGSRVNDYLPDVDEGQDTLLNTRRWKFASFFNRVKRQVAENWRPDLAYKRRDPTGNVYGFRDRLTILRVHLDPRGKLLDLHLEQASGVEFLDDEAINAFRAAEPFPNPPQGLVDKDSGQISFRFGFLFELSRRPTFRIFRGN